MGLTFGYFASTAIALAALVVAPMSRAGDSTVSGQSDALLPISTCRAVPDAEARLKCYDNAVDSLVAAVARKDVRIVDRDQIKTAKKGLFGFNIGKVALFGNGDTADSEDDRQLATTMTNVRALANGRWRFIVEDGAVWETAENEILVLSPKVGAKVELSKGALGAYFAKIGSAQRVRAKRIE